jgi:SAM-dependent methyltransferase
LPEVHEGSYDIVFASYGALLWLRDLGAWATTIERFLAPGGFFYIVDGHPLASGLSNDAFSNGAEARFEMPYFTSAHPNVFDVGGTYAEAGVATTHNRTKEWSHSLSEIISVLLERGLVIELFQEHRHCAWPIFDSVVRDQAGDYRLPANLEDRLPLMFSMRARKPDAG